MSRTITHILVPTDFSPTSEVALDYAVSFARRFRASLHVLHVVEDPFDGATWGSEVYITSLPAMRASLIDQAARKLSPLVRRAEGKSVAAKSEVCVGRPAAVIRKVAEDQAVDLIVMGTHGRSGMAHLLLGSVAEKMLREAPCPVLTVRGTAASSLPPERNIVQREPARTQ